MEVSNSSSNSNVYTRDVIRSEESYLLREGVRHFKSTENASGASSTYKASVSEKGYPVEQPKDERVGSLSPVLSLIVDGARQLEKTIEELRRKLNFAHQDLDFVRQDKAKVEQVLTSTTQSLNTVLKDRDTLMSKVAALESSNDAYKLRIAEMEKTKETNNVSRNAGIEAAHEALADNQEKKVKAAEVNRDALTSEFEALKSEAETYKLTIANLKEQLNKAYEEMREMRMEEKIKQLELEDKAPEREMHKMKMFLEQALRGRDMILKTWQELRGRDMILKAWQAFSGILVKSWKIST